MLTGLHKNFRFPFPSPACLSGEKCQFDSFAWLFSKSDLFLWDPQTFWLVKVTIKTFNLVSQSSWERKDGAEPKSLIPSRSSKALMHISHRVASARSCPPPVRGRLPCSSLYLGKLQLALCPVSPVSAARALSSQGSFSSTVNKRIQISTTALTHCTTPHHTTPHHITSERPNCVSLRVDSIPSCSLSSCGCCCRVFVVVCLSSLCCVLLPCVCRHRVFLVTVFVSSCVCSHCLLWFCRCVFVRRVFVVVVMFMSPLCFPCRRVFVVGMSCRVFVHRHHIFLVAVFVFVACLFSLCLSGCVPHTAQSAPRCLLVSPAGTTADCSAHSVW